MIGDKCAKCGILLTAENYMSKNVGNVCRQCRKIYYKDWNGKNKLAVRSYSRKHYVAHANKINSKKRLVRETIGNEWGRLWAARLGEIWGQAKGGRHLRWDNNPVVVNAEIYTAQEILPKEGFTDILLTRPINYHFPFDILAKKDGRICLVDVTVSVLKCMAAKKLPLVRFFQARVFHCHVKRDFSKYYLLELQPNRRTTEIYGLVSRESKAF